MCSTSKTLTISDLTDDMLCEIFDRLTVKQVLAIQTVDKQFHRCAKKWIKTVDELTVDHLTLDDCGFLLNKSFGKQTAAARDWIRISQPTLFASLEKMLTVFTEIKIVDLRSTPFTASQLIQLVSRCPNISRFSIKFFTKLVFTDDEWTRLVQLIKHCDIRLSMFCFKSPNFSNHLEQLFTVATGIKSVSFAKLLGASVYYLKTIAFLDQSATVAAHYCHFDEAVDGEVSDLVDRRVDILSLNTIAFEALSVRRFSKLSQLYLVALAQPFNCPPVLQFPRLKSLKIQDSHSPEVNLISDFFSAVGRLDQLEELELQSNDFLIDDKSITEMIAKTPNITELRILWSNNLPTDIPNLEKLIQFWSQSSAPLRNVVLNLDVEELSVDDFGRALDTLVGFASRRTETKFTLVFKCSEENQAMFEEKAKNLPKNLEIKPRTARPLPLPLDLIEPVAQ